MTDQPESAPDGGTAEATTPETNAADVATTETTPTAPLPGDRPQTGDRAVDDALADFDRAVSEGASAHVGAAAEAHRALQSRLTSPPPEPPAPGQARPGPAR